MTEHEALKTLGHESPCERCANRIAELERMLADVPRLRKIEEVARIIVEQGGCRETRYALALVWALEGKQ